MAETFHASSEAYHSEELDGAYRNLQVAHAQHGATLDQQITIWESMGVKELRDAFALDVPDPMSYGYALGLQLDIMSQKAVEDGDTGRAAVLGQLCEDCLNEAGERPGDWRGRPATSDKQQALVALQTTYTEQRWVADAREKEVEVVLGALSATDLLAASPTEPLDYRDQPELLALKNIVALTKKSAAQEAGDTVTAASYQQVSDAIFTESRRRIQALRDKKCK